MSTRQRRILLVLGLIAVLGGCNPFTLPFILMRPEPKLPAEMKQIADVKNDKQVRVAILAHMGLEPNSDLINADRELSRRMSAKLKELAEANEEKIKVINPLKVEEYRNARMDWSQELLDLHQVGKDLKVDYVIYLEISGMSLYQPGSNGTFYQGKANITVTLADIKNPDDFTTAPKQINFSYPSDSRGGNIPVDADTTPQQFRDKFFDNLARRLTWQFTAHPTKDNNWCE